MLSCSTKAMVKTVTKEKIQPYIWAIAIFFFMSFVSAWSKSPQDFFPLLFNNIWHLIYIVILNYILFEFTIPFVLRKRRFILFNIILAFISIFIHAIFYSYGGYLWRELGMRLHIYTSLVTYPNLGKLLENQMAYSVGSVFIFGIIRHVYRYLKLKEATQQLRIEKQQAELNYLKSQTNPHFLFNTLNNIYSLTRDKSDLAPQSILKLSKILRFMLYETSGPYITIERELQIINDYIALEKLRYDESLEINFSYDVEDLKQSIPPLLLMPLVENAFKHGVSETRQQPFVNIHLSINKRQLVFVVKNSSEEPAMKPVKENIGLSNLRRQLELLYTDHSLIVQRDKELFTATLKINLVSHV